MASGSEGGIGTCLRLARPSSVSTYLTADGLRSAGDSGCEEEGGCCCCCGAGCLCGCDGVVVAVAAPLAPLAQLPLGESGREAGAEPAATAPPVAATGVIPTMAPPPPPPPPLV